MGRGNRVKGTNQFFDPEFRFLLALDPAFEQWQVLASEWFLKQPGFRTQTNAAPLTAFFVRYLYKLQLDKRPVAIFEAGSCLPDLWTTLNLASYKSGAGIKLHDHISDFLQWVLHTHLTEPDADGFLVKPKHLHNPFPRLKIKITHKGADLNFDYVVAQDQRMSHWQKLAAEWLSQQKRAVPTWHVALDKFLVAYIIGCGLARNPITYLSRASPPAQHFHDVLLNVKTKGAIGQLSRADIKLNNSVAEFLDWVLNDKLSIEDEHGLKVIPPSLHNPVVRQSPIGFIVPTETTKAALSIRYIEELRTMLAEGPVFRDWLWAQQAMEAGSSGGDWFRVPPYLIDPDDPDCVWRERAASAYERKYFKTPSLVTEMWSPVRAVALYLKLELPLRTFQVRMLDSGEADTWSYIHGLQGGNFVLNDSPLATGSVARPYQRGVFHRSLNESGAGLFINTNKTADYGKAENDKGYVIPWVNETVLYWLTKLRRWQERYNPLSTPTAWTELEWKHFGVTPPHPQVLEERGSTCFLFRDAAGNGNDRQKPIISAALDRIWYLLLARLEQRCLMRAETLDDGTQIKFVNENSPTTTFYPLHALRVSLISYLVLDLQLPLAVVSKLIAGHARLIMTLYYTKCGYAYMKEVLSAAERNALAAEEANHRRFLMDATMEQISQRFASISSDAVYAAVGHKSAATFVFEDKGICSASGTLCAVGGECVNENQRYPVYAPVPGYPEQRNCVRCRFFLSGPAFLPGLQAHFNSLSYEAHERAERHNELQAAITDLENHRADCERDGRLFTATRELEKLSQRYEAEAEAMGKVINDLQATYHLIGRSLEIMKQANQDGVQLVAVGEMDDIQMVFTETASELHQLEILCENATLYPEIDSRKPSLRRAQLLDCMLALNKMPPIFFRLSPQQQLEVGNAVMQLIQARTGSLKGALEFAEGRRRLQEIGLVEETWNVLSEKVSGTSIRQLINTARSTVYDGDSYAS
ncbi:integrase family protein [Aeromonas veronii]